MLKKIKGVLVKTFEWLKRLASNLFNRIPLPVTLKVTMWYGIFLTFIFAVLIGSIFLLSDNITEYTTRRLLIENVNDASGYKHDIKGFEDGVFISKYNSDGVIIGGSMHPDFPSNIEFRDGIVRKSVFNSKEFLYYDSMVNRRNTEDKIWIRGIVSLDTANLISGGALIIISIVLPIVLVFIIYFGYKIIKKAFVPVEEISNLALEIGNKNDLSKRIEIRKNKDEIQKMSLAFNSMLESLENYSLKEKQFTSDVSHELRTPVSVIKAESEYALEFADSIDDMKESLGIINRQSEKMSDMISQLLNLSRMDRTDSMTKEKLDISVMIKSIIDEQSMIIDNEKIELITDIESGVFAEGDKLLLQRAVNNLLSNAVKFTNDKIKLTLRKSIDDKKTFEIIVEDNGIGISEENQSKVWDRFFQADESRTKKKNDGAGLGLSIVKQIVDMHGGTVLIDSKVGIGSKFIIILPVYSF